ncbi:MAG: hypothetical protein JO148_13145 [Acidimicrobiia bacterium]|nr:hypothetical protein [Acidimicrobiia bacterium]
MNDEDHRHLPEALGKAAGAGLHHREVPGLARVAVSSMRKAGAGAVGGGRWLADTVLEMIPHIPVRDLSTLQEHHYGATGATLAGELIRNASRMTAAVGATTGALAAAEDLSPPSWIVLPIELVIETLVVAAIEMKLVAELHEVYARPIPGHGPDRALALARAWAERRGVSPRSLVTGGGLGEVLGRGTRNEIMRLMRRRLMRRTLRNTTSLAPFLIGAVAGAEINRRATANVGDAIVRDLAASRPWERH